MDYLIGGGCAICSSVFRLFGFCARVGPLLRMLRRTPAIPQAGTISCMNETTSQSTLPEGGAMYLVDGHKSNRTLVERHVKESARRGCVSNLSSMQDSGTLQRLAGLKSQSHKWTREAACVARLPISTETFEIQVCNSANSSQLQSWVQ